MDDRQNDCPPALPYNVSTLLTLNGLVQQLERTKNQGADLQGFRDLEVAAADAHVSEPAEEHEGDGLR